MAKVKVEDIRDIAFVGHGAAGKTTLVDLLLNKTGALNRPASVDDGTSICDFDEEEKAHKYSIESSVVHFDHGGLRYFAVDTPGYADFVGQAIGAMAGVDTAIVTINATSGIEVNTRRVFNEAENQGLGRIILINRMDGDNVDYPVLVESIKELWGPKCVPLNVPIGQGPEFKGVASTLKPPADADGALLDPSEISESLLESIIEVDEAVMERYFEGTQPTDEEVKTLMVQAVASGSLIPILCCSSKLDIGVDEFLAALAQCAVPPGTLVRKTMQGESEVEVKPDPAGPLVGQVFKTRIDPFVQKLSFLRILSGTIKKDQSVPVSGERKPIKFSQLFQVQADKTESIDEAGPGDIVAVAKVDELKTGRSVGDSELPAINFPTPMVGLAVTPKARGDEAKLSGALNKIVEEDPTFRIERDAQTKEMVMMGMSDLHLKIVQERLQRRDKVELDTHEPKIPYRETIQSQAEGSYRHKKQSGGRGQFGEVHIRMFPLARGTNIEEYAVKSRFNSMREYHYDDVHNFLWIDSIVGGTIPNNFLAACRSVELRAETIRLGTLKQYLYGIQVVNHCRMQWVLSGEIPYDAGWPMSYAVDEGDRSLLRDHFVQLPKLTVEQNDVPDHQIV